MRTVITTVIVIIGGRMSRCFPDCKKSFWRWQSRYVQLIRPERDLGRD